MIESIIVGMLAGYLAGKLIRGGGFGWLGNLLLGLIGGAVGGWLFDLLNISWGGTVGQIGTAFVGALVILYIASLIKK